MTVADNYAITLIDGPSGGQTIRRPLAGADIEVCRKTEFGIAYDRYEWESFDRENKTATAVYRNSH